MTRLQRASDDLARGNRETSLLQGRSRWFNDEVGQLARAFSVMAEAVADREERLAVRNGELRLILDSVEQGFLTALPDGTLREERSAIVQAWFGELSAKAKVWDLVARADSSAAEWMELGWQQLVEDWLPLEVSIEQLPKRLTHEDREFEIAYHPVCEGEELVQVVLVITDVTAEVQRQRAMADQHEFSILVDRFLADRHAFVEFWEEASELVRRVTQSTGAADESLRRDLHTLKGNARFYGLARLSSLCHELESALGERASKTLTDQERASLSKAWKGLRRRVEPLTHGGASYVEISEDEYANLLAATTRGTSPAALERLVRGLRFEPTRRRLRRARDAIEATCQKLDKSKPQVVIEDHGLRLPPARWAAFWRVLPHILNNAADHGLEPDDERVRLGKDVPGKIHLGARQIGQHLVIEVADDGRGIDWQRVREVAAERGLPHASHDELVTALLSDGFSLSKSVSLVSGRGVGLAAVRAEVEALQGNVEVESAAGRGTTWRFRFPERVMEDDGSSWNPPSVPPSAPVERSWAP